MKRHTYIYIINLLSISLSLCYCYPGSLSPSNFLCVQILAAAVACPPISPRMVPRLCDRHAAARLTRRHLKVLLVDLGYAVNPFIVLQVLVARGLGGALLLHVRLD